MAIVTKAPPQRHSKGLSGSTGFGTVEVLAAFFVLTVALTSLLALMAHGVATMKLVEDDIIAKQKAREALESIYTSRNTAQITFDMINNTTTIPGIFLAGFQPLREANPAGGGGDGLIGTADDGDIEVLTLPGPDGLLGTGDDEVRPLDNFEREIRIDPILYVDLTVNPDVRRVIVSIRFHTPLGGLRTFQVESYISRFR